jgi:hypothetical protein
MKKNLANLVLAVYLYLGCFVCSMQLNETQASLRLPIFQKMSSSNGAPVSEETSNNCNIILQLPFQEESSSHINTTNQPSLPRDNSASQSLENSIQFFSSSLPPPVQNNGSSKSVSSFPPFLSVPALQYIPLFTPRTPYPISYSNITSPASSCLSFSEQSQPPSTPSSFHELPIQRYYRPAPQKHLSLLQTNITIYNFEARRQPISKDSSFSIPVPCKPSPPNLMRNDYSFSLPKFLPSNKRRKSSEAPAPLLEMQITLYTLQHSSNPSPSAFFTYSPASPVPLPYPLFLSVTFPNSAQNSKKTKIR